MIQDRVVETLNALESAGIEYCVLRNYGFVTGEPIDGDVDVLVQESDKDTIIDILQRHGYKIGEGDTTRQTLCKRSVPGESDRILLDLYWDAPTYNGVPFLDGDLVLENCRPYPANEPSGKQIYIPRREEYFVELVFHGALNKNRYRESYRSDLEELRTAVDRTTVLAHAELLFGTIGCRAMKDALAGQFSGVLDRKWRLVAANCRHDPFAIPILFWNLIVLREIIRPVRSCWTSFNSEGPIPVIALYGPDGAGKSTIARKLQERLAENLDCRVAELGVYNGETRFLRTIKTFRNTIVPRNRGGSSTETSDTPQRIGGRQTTAHALVYLIDIWLRVVRERKNSDVLIADRYVHDILLYADPGPLGRIFPWFEQPPFYGYVLVGPPEHIAKRSEYDAESIAIMYDRLEELNFQTVDVTQPPEAVVNDILSSLGKTDILDQE